MFRRLRPMLLLAALVLLLVPGVALAQVGNISGVARDSQGGALPGVTVTATSPALIEKQRTTVTDSNGRYQITNLPVGVYEVSFSLENFSDFKRGNVELTSDFTANVNADMKLGARNETVTVIGQPPTVDIQNARQRQVFTGEDLRNLPTTRDLRSLVDLVPGISVSSSNGAGNVQQICSGGGGGFVDAGAFSYTATGALGQCSPILNGFASNAHMNDSWALDQGRIQVDGLGIQSSAGGGRTSYIPDVANAQEVTFTLSGNLGESETGGAIINIVPRTGGNRFNGNYFTSYSNGTFYDRNNGTRRTSFLNLLDYDYQVSGSYGGPILRDRLWFYTAPSQRGRSNILNDTWHNANEGIFGANFMQDRARGAIGSTEEYKNVSLRLTLQATQKNKFNIFWDEQYTCENPCKGTSTGFTSPEAQGTSVTWPLHLAQLNWTNPLTNRILLDARVSHYSSHVDQTRNRYLPNYPSIPRISETGTTTQNGTNGQATSGSLNPGTYWNNDNWQMQASASYITGSHSVKLGYQGAILSTHSSPRYNDLRMSYTYATPAVPNFCSASTSATTRNACISAIGNGSAVANGAVLAPDANGVMSIQTGCYLSPAQAGQPGAAFATAPTQTANGTNWTARPWCGSINLAGNPNGLNDPINSQYLPIPNSFTMYIPAERNEKVWFTALYLQDQWTWGRLTMNGALRYDNSQSRFLETCIGPDAFIAHSFCVNSPDAPEGKDGKGVNFQDLTPRWGVAWDLFGNGKTALKFNMGKYVGGAGVSGVYTASNVAGTGRFQSSFIRGWTDLDGDRVVDCDLTIPVQAPSTNTAIPGNGECAAIPTTGSATANSVATYRRFGRSPDELDDSGLTIGLGNIQCGRKDSTRIPAAADAYCNAYFAQGGDTLLDGWGKRRYEWQAGLGIQHELLPRLSAEVTYNWRANYNSTIQDEVGVGCDLYGPGATQDPDECMRQQLEFRSDWYDFYSVQAPLDPKLPGGGGYLIPGFADRKPGVVLPASQNVTVEVLDIDHRIKDSNRSVDVNLTLRARGGLRLSGGTSTSKRYRDACFALVDPGDITGGTTGVVFRGGQDRACINNRPFQTNVRGTATYTIPWVDVLLSTVFSYRPGAQLYANYQMNIADIIWAEGSESRASNTNECGIVAGVVVQGCLLSANTSQTVTQNLLSNTSFGEGIRLFDIKLAKNIRFGGRRLNVGMDIYNAFNSDAAQSYCNTYPTCGSVAGGTLRPWLTVERLVTPRYARFQVQFDF